MSDLFNYNTHMYAAAELEDKFWNEFVVAEFERPCWASWWSNKFSKFKINNLIPGSRLDL